MKKQPSIGTQIFRGLLVGIIIIVIIRTCNETPEDSMRQYQKEQKEIRQYEKKQKATKEYYKRMGEQE